MVIKFIEKLAKKTATEIDDLLVSILSRPLSFLIVAGGIFSALLILGIKHFIVLKVIKTLFVFVISWTLYNFIISFEVYIYKFYTNSDNLAIWLALCCLYL